MTAGGGENREPTGATRSFGLIVAVVILGCVLTVLVLWIGAILVGPGRTIENSIWRGSLDTPRVGEDLARVLVRVAGALSVIGCAGILLNGLIRRRLRPALVAVATVGLSLASVELLKHHLIVRPVGGHTNVILDRNTFPSGHVAVVASAAFALLIVEPTARRRLTMVVAATVIAFQAIAVMALGWHRPSDAIAAVAISSAWATVGIWLLHRSAASATGREGGSGATVPTDDGRLLLSTLEVVIAMFAAVNILRGPMVPVPDRVGFVIAEFIVGAVGVVAVGVISWLLRLSRPVPAGPRTTNGR